MHSLGGVFDDVQPVSVGDRHDRVHLAAHSGVVHGEDGAGAGRDRPLDEQFIEVERVGPDVYEHGTGAAEGDGIGRGDEGERRHDHLVSLAEVEHQGRHLEGRGARGREQHMLHAKPLLHQPAAGLREVAVAADVAERDGLGDVEQLLPGDEGLVEWDSVKTIHGETVTRVVPAADCLCL